MNIEIIRDKDNLFSEWIHGIGSIFEDMGKIHRRSGFSDKGFAFANMI
jgi:hypothetical protein